MLSSGIIAFSLRLEPALSGLPVDDIPDSAEVLCLAVLILEAIATSVLFSNTLKIPTGTSKGRRGELLVSVLPGINPQQRRILPCHRVLVRQSNNLQLLRLFILYEPAPPATLDTRKGGIHDLLEFTVVAPCGVDGIGKRA